MYKKINMQNFDEKFRLDNKLSFVIGSEGLIGKKIVEYFTSSGSKVICIDKSFKKIVNNHNISTVKFDVSKNNLQLDFLLV